MRYLSAIGEHRRLVRVALLVLATAGAIGVTYAGLAPEPIKVGTQYKFMHCRECGFERPYEPIMAAGKCPQCKPPKVGYFTPTLERIGMGNPTSPWWTFRIALAAEVVVFLGALWFLLRQRARDDEEEELYCRCPYSKRRLRFREAAAGKPGQCPRCKRFFRFPDESERFPENAEVGVEEV